VTSYVVTPYIGATAQTPTTTVTGAPPATNVRIEGLQTSSQYTFTVHAANGNGNGQESTASNAVTPQAVTAPTAPTGVSAVAGSSAAQVTWTAPGDDGGSPITGYTITPFIGSQAQTATTAGAGATSATVSGLADGSNYTFVVTAKNAIGSTASAASAAVTPYDTVLDFGTPATVDGGDNSSVVLGMKFTTSLEGIIQGVRFYKAAANTGTHVGALWTSSGQLLASATFANESASGWQTVLFSQPVQIEPGTTYVVSYTDPNGHYSFTSGAFNSAVTNNELQAPATGTTANGVYTYSGSNAFPTSSFGGASYWVDVLFQSFAAPGQVTGVTASAGQSSATVSWSAPTSGGAVTKYVVTPWIGSTAQATTTVTGTPPATTATINNLTPGTQYTFSVHAANANASGSESAHSSAITPQGATAPSAPTGVTAAAASGQALVSWTGSSGNGSAITGYTVTPSAGGTPVQVGASATSATVTGLTNGTSYTFTVTATNGVGSTPSSPSSAVTPYDTILDFSTPATVDSGDGGSNNLGVRFVSTVAGQVEGIRFYKAATNTGAHIGSLWSATGQLLASATFTNESASGWETVLFSQPVSIQAGTQYVASYFAPNGHYSFTSSVFGTAVTNGPLQAVANGSNPNGSYLYAGSSVFPTNGFQSSNFWVDVLFQPSP
jgi:hypothetical protein